MPLCPRGPRSDRVMLSRPSSLNRPHAPHSQAHRDFVAVRLIRDAFAVHARLGDSRVVPGFRCSFLPGMPSSMTPGSSAVAYVQYREADKGLRRDLSGSALPQSRNPLHAGHAFGAFRFASATACKVAGPPVWIRPGLTQPPGAFTSRLPAGRSPFPLLDITTTATGLLCRWDSHPLEWQLASLHQIRACRITALGSCLRC
jgi:hypothetical protein